MLSLFILASTAPSLSQGSAASPDSVEDCERLQGVDEYNRCLARFGPPAGAIGAGTARPPRGVDPAPETETSAASRSTSAAAARRPATTRDVTLRRVSGGRKAASFTIVTGRPRAVPAKRAAPRPPRRR